MNYLTINENNIIVHPAVLSRIKEVNQGLKELKADDKAIREILKDEMEERFIKSVSVDGVTITYIAPTYSEYFDLERFRLEHPDMYDEYVGIKEKNASVRITVKEPKDAD